MDNQKFGHSKSLARSERGCMYNMTTWCHCLFFKIFKYYSQNLQGKSQEKIKIKVASYQQRAEILGKGVNFLPGWLWRQWSWCHRPPQTLLCRWASWSCCPAQSQTSWQRKSSMRWEHSKAKHSVNLLYITFFFSLKDTQLGEQRRHRRRRKEEAATSQSMERGGRTERKVSFWTWKGTEWAGAVLSAPPLLRLLKSREWQMVGWTNQNNKKKNGKKRWSKISVPFSKAGRQQK